MYPGANVCNRYLFLGTPKNLTPPKSKKKRQSSLDQVSLTEIPGMLSNEHGVTSLVEKFAQCNPNSATWNRRSTGNEFTMIWNHKIDQTDESHNSLHISYTNYCCYIHQDPDTSFGHPHCFSCNASSFVKATPLVVHDGASLEQDMRSCWCLTP